MLPDSEIQSLLNSLSDPEDLDTSTGNSVIDFVRDDVVNIDTFSVVEGKICYKFKIGVLFYFITLYFTHISYNYYHNLLELETDNIEYNEDCNTQINMTLNMEPGVTNSYVEKYCDMVELNNLPTVQGK